MHMHQSDIMGSVIKSVLRGNDKILPIRFELRSLSRNFADIDFIIHFVPVSALINILCLCVISAFLFFVLVSRILLRDFSRISSEVRFSLQGVGSRRFYSHDVLITYPNDIIYEYIYHKFGIVLYELVDSKKALIL